MVSIVRSAILRSAGLLLAILGAAILGLMVQPAQPADATTLYGSGTPGKSTQTVYVYTAPGETVRLRVQFLTKDKFSLAGWDENRMAKAVISVSDPGPAAKFWFTKAYNGHSRVDMGDATFSASAAGRVTYVDAGDNIADYVRIQNSDSLGGVWEIKIYTVDSVGALSVVNTDDVNTYTTMQSANAIVNWQVEAESAGSFIPGRVWVDRMDLQQDAEMNLDIPTNIKATYMGPTGMQYNVTQLGYMGMESYLRADDLGLANTACTRLYYSSRVDNAGVRRVWDCPSAQVWRIFWGRSGAYEAPNPSLPVTARWFDGSTRWVQPDYLPQTSTTPTLTQDATSIYYAGTVAATLSNQRATFDFWIDTDNDGVYTDANDRHWTLGKVDPGAKSVWWDGLDGNGVRVKRSQPIRLLTTMSDVGELHFVAADLEMRTGIQIAQAVGPTVGLNTISWNDTPLGTTCQQYNNSTGATDTVTCRPSQTPVKAATNVSSAAGVHGWAATATAPAYYGSWGDQRYINDWTSTSSSLWGPVRQIAAVSVANPLTVTVTASPTAAGPDQDVVYTMTVRNGGTLTAPSVDPILLLPASATFVSADNGGGFTAVDDRVRWGAVDMATGTTITRAVRVRFPAGTARPQTLSAFGTAAGDATIAVPPAAPTVANCTVSSCDVVNVSLPAMQLSVTLTDAVTQVAPSQQVTYTATASNPMAVVVPGVVVTIQLPAGVTGVTAGGTGVWNATTNRITYPAFTLAANQSGVTRSVTANISPAALYNSTHTAYATIYGTDTSGVTQPALSRTNYALNSGFNGWGTWSATGGTASAGGIFDIGSTVVTNNNLPYTANVVAAVPGQVWSGAFTLSVPAGYPAVAIKPALVPYDATTWLGINMGAEVVIQPGTTVRLEVENITMPAGTIGVRMMTYMGTASATAGRRLVYSNATLERATTVGTAFTGSVSPGPTFLASWTGTADASASILESIYNPASDGCVTVQCDADVDTAIFSTPLTATVTVSDAAVGPGETVTYTSTVRNTHATFTASNVVGKLFLPDGVVAGTPSNSGTMSGQDVTWPAVTLAPGASVVRTITATFPAGLARPLVLSAFTTGQGTGTIDVPPANPTAATCAPLTSCAQVDVSLPALPITVSVTDGLTQVQPGQLVTYTVTASNPVAVPVSNVVLSAYVPVGATGVVPANGGIFNAATGIVTWPAFNFAASQSGVVRTVKLNMPTSATYNSTLTAYASIAGDDTPDLPPSVVVRWNSTTDPRATSFTSVAGGWRSTRWFGSAGATGTYTTVTGAADTPIPGLTTYARKAWTAVTGTNGDLGFEHGPGGTGATPVNPGDVWTFSSYLRTSQAYGDGSSSGGHMQVYWYDAAGTYLSQTSGALSAMPAMVWTRLGGTFTAPAGAEFAMPVSDLDGLPVTVGFVVHGTGLLIEKVASVQTYFDGTFSPDGAYAPSWKGAANGSQSVLSRPYQPRTDGCTGTGCASDTDTAIYSAPLNVTVSTDKAAVGPGESFTYTVTVTNPHATFVATSVVPKLFLPAGLTVGAPSNSGTYDSTSKTVLWAATNVAPGASLSRTITVTANAGLSRPQVLAAFATGQGTGTTPVAPLSPDDTNCVVTSCDKTNVTLPTLAIQVDITDQVTQVEPGQQVTFTVTATNPVGVVVPGVDLVSYLPAGATAALVSDGGTFNLPSMKVTWPAFTLAANQTVTRTVTVNMPTGVRYNDTVSTFATIEGTDTPAAPAVPTLALCVSPSCAVDTDSVRFSTPLSVTLTADRAQAGPGQPVLYTLTATNTHPTFIATNVVPKMFLPTSMTAGALSDAGVWNSGTQQVVWPAVTLAPGDSVSRTFSASPNFGKARPQVMTAYATVQGDGTTPVPPVAPDASNCNVATCTKTDVALPVLPVTANISDGNMYAFPGQTVTWTMVASNPVGVVVPNVVMVTTLPAGVTGVTASNGGIWNSSTGQVTWPAFTMIANQSGPTYTVTATMPVVMTRPGTSTAYVTIGGTDTPAVPATPTLATCLASGCAFDTDTVPAISFTVSNTDGTTWVRGDDQLTWTVTAKNGAPTPETGVNVALSLPGEGTWVSSSAGGAVASGTVTWAGLTFAAGETKTFTVTAKANTSLVGTTFVSVATVSEGAASVSATDTDQVAIDRLTVQKEICTTGIGCLASAAPGTGGWAETTTVTEGAGLLWRVRVNNVGNRPLTNVQVADPAVTTCQSTTATLVEGTDTGWKLCSDTANRAGFINTATATGTAETAKPVTAADTASVIINAIPKLSVTKTDSVSSLLPGQTVTYTLTFTNSHSWFTEVATVGKDFLPTQEQLVSASNSGTISGQTVTWPAVSLAPGASVTRTVTATVDPMTPRPISVTNFATVDGATGPNPPADPTTACVAPLCASDTDTVNIAPDALSVIKTASKSFPKPGDTFTYTLTAANAASYPLLNTVLTDFLPVEVTFVSATGSGTYSAATRKVTWPAFTLAANATQVRTITVTVNANVAWSSTFTNFATGTTDGGLVPPVVPTVVNCTGNLVCSGATSKVPASAAGLEVEKSVATPGPFTAGQSVTFNYKVTSTSPTTVSGIAVVDNKGVVVTCPKTTLEPAESMVCTGVGPLTVTP